MDGRQRGQLFQVEVRSLCATITVDCGTLYGAPEVCLTLDMQAQGGSPLASKRGPEYEMCVRTWEVMLSHSLHLITCC